MDINFVFGTNRNEKFFLSVYNLVCNIVGPSMNNINVLLLKDILLYLKYLLIFQRIYTTNTKHWHNEHKIMFDQLKLQHLFIFQKIKPTTQHIDTMNTNYLHLMNWNLKIQPQTKILITRFTFNKNYFATHLYRSSNWGSFF